MKPEDELFLRALDLPPAERAAYLDRTCGDDAALRARLEKLLQASGEDDVLLDRPPVRPEPLAGEEGPGDVIDRYTLVRRLGTGGGGVVWLAEQTQPVRRQVALKVIKLGMDTAQVMTRFEAERQALAVMDHPDIARVFDAGATGTGRPFFVMEYVDGVPITTYCDEHNLGVPERLELFARLCGAIQHAHQKGIIHRDVKPSNVLVGTVDGVPAPKVIDFGIAKATEQRLTDATLVTQEGLFLGTPAYMSPEQSGIGAGDVDTRTDVYSLGVLLYELLAGTPPFEPKALLAAGLEAMWQQIREVDPPRPSARLQTLAPEVLRTTASRRLTEAPKLIHRIAGDLDWIVMRCLEKDRARRYETAAGLAEDIRRHLGNLPVEARPAGAGYRLAKLVRRNRLAVAAATAVVLALVAGTVVSTWQAVRANRAEAVAQAEAARAGAAEITARREAATAEAVSAFLREDLLSQANSYTQGEANQEIDPDIKVRTALDRAAAAVGERFAAEPLVEAAVRHTIGAAYQGLGLGVEAAGQLRRALDLRTQHMGREAPDTVETMALLSSSLRDGGGIKEGLAVIDELVAIRKKAGDEAKLLEALGGKTDLLRADGHYEESIALAREVVARRDALNEPDDEERIADRQRLALCLLENEQFEEARELQREVLRRKRERYGSMHPKVLYAIGDLAASEVRLGAKEEALVLNEEALAVARQVLGSDHIGTVKALTNLASAYQEVRRFDEALALNREAVEIARRILGDENPLTVTVMNNLAFNYRAIGRMEEAVQAFLDLLPVAEKVFGPNHRNTFTFYNSLGACYYDLGRYDDGLLWLQRGYDGLCAELGREHPMPLRVMTFVARALHQVGRHEDSLAMWELQMELIGDTMKPFEPVPHANHEGKALALEALGRYADAAVSYQAYLDILLERFPKSGRSIQRMEDALKRVADAQAQAQLGDAVAAEPGSP